MQGASVGGGGGQRSTTGSERVDGYRALHTSERIDVMVMPSALAVALRRGHHRFSPDSSCSLV